MSTVTSLQKIHSLRCRYQNPANRKPGWDQIARNEAIDILVEHHFGKATMDRELNKTDAFLAVLIDHFEEE